MARPFVICAAQMGPNSEDQQENVNRIISMIHQAGERGVQLISFPECAFTPFFAVKNDPGFDHYVHTLANDYSEEIISVAKNYGMAVILPYAEKTSNKLYNSAVIYDFSGTLLGKYRKIHLPGSFVSGGVKNFEKFYFTPGDLGFPVFDLGSVKIGIQICYDRHFPEGFRALALKGAEVVFNVTAAGGFGTSWRAESWELLLRTRAIENGMYIVGVNKVGKEYEQDYFGRSLIASPLGGEILARSKENQGDELIIQSIDLDLIVQARKRTPVFRDLRPDQYSKEIYYL